MMIFLFYVITLLAFSKSNNKEIDCSKEPISLKSQIFRQTDSRLRIKLNVPCLHGYSFHSVFLALPGG